MPSSLIVADTERQRLLLTDVKTVRFSRRGLIVEIKIEIVIVVEIVVVV